jgi:hypothetical protein
MDMDETGFVKDESEYVVFSCTKCHQYSYVKITQKTKKCLRCGRSYQVKALLNSSTIIVKGMSAAVITVKNLQNQLGTPSFRTGQEFVITSNNTSTSPTFTSNSNLPPHEAKFLSLLADLSSRHKQFPLYLIELMAPDYDIPKELIATLTTQCLKSKILLKRENNQYYAQLPSQ